MTTACRARLVNRSNTGISVRCRLKHVNTMLLIWTVGRVTLMDWEDRLDDWELGLELNAQLEGSDWVTLERAAADTGASRAALRNWYRTGQIPSRLADGPHGPQRLVPLALVAARAEASPRLRRTTERRLADQAQLEILRHRVDRLELRLAALEGRQHGNHMTPPA